MVIDYNRQVPSFLPTKKAGAAAEDWERGMKPVSNRSTSCVSSSEVLAGDVVALLLVAGQLSGHRWALVLDGTILDSDRW